MLGQYLCYSRCNTAKSFSLSILQYYAGPQDDKFYLLIFLRRTFLLQFACQVLKYHHTIISVVAIRCKFLQAKNCFAWLYRLKKKRKTYYYRLTCQCKHGFVFKTANWLKPLNPNSQNFLQSPLYILKFMWYMWPAVVYQGSRLPCTRKIQVKPAGPKNVTTHATAGRHTKCCV